MLSYPQAATAKAPDVVDGSTSIQYQEALSHAGQKYVFKAGGTVTVPFQPRKGDTESVDGSTPVALPAAQGAPQAATNSLLTPAVSSTNTYLRREVYGFLPYWELGTGLDYDSVSTIAYFGVGLNVNGSSPVNLNDPNIGTLAQSGNNWNGWVSTTMTNVINTAHAHGTRVALTIESFAWDSGGQAAQSQILSTDANRLRTAQSIAAEVARRGVDGVNLDFEPIASGQKANFVTFTRQLRQALDAIHPGYELTFCANGSAGTYDLGGLLATGAADAVFIMAYDLRGGSPATTGSIDPMTGSNTYTLNSIVNYFLTHGAPANKVLLGLPWYGHAWSTGASNALNAPPGGIASYGAPATGVTYDTSKGLASRDPATTPCAADYPVPCVNGWQYDPIEQTAWTAYYGNYGGTSNTWRELYFDDARSLGAKIDAVDNWKLRGVGIWALGYDNNNGVGDLTATIASKLELAGTTYTGVTPARLLDTRDGTGGLRTLRSHQAQGFTVWGRGGVPVGATAVTGNLTVTQQSSRGFMYIGPAAADDPASSNLNFPVGDDRANAVTVALSGDGRLFVTYAAPVHDTPTAQAIFDVTGYFTGDTTGATFHALTPARILDSRDGTGGISAALKSHQAAGFSVWGQGGVPTGATAVTGNLTVTQQTTPGFLYLGPNSTNDPTTSTLNFPRGDDRANAVTVALSADGKLYVTYAAATRDVPTAQVVFDVTGYFTADATGATYVPLTPSRILDTRYGTGGISTPLRSHQAGGFAVWGRGGVPTSNVVAVTGNLTVTGQTSLGFLYVGPGAANDPTSSNLNFPKGDDRANAVTVALAPDGRLYVTYAAPIHDLPTAHAIFDVTGYFVP